MPRNLSAAMQAQAAAAANEPLHLVEAHFDAGVIRANDGFRTVIFNGESYPANGYLLGFDGLSEDAKLQVADVTVSLSGVPSTLVSAVLAEDYLDRRLVIYKGFMQSGALVVDPTPIFDGMMDEPAISEDPEAGDCIVTIAASNHWSKFTQRSGRRSNDAIQQLFYPGDGFFKLCSEFAGKREMIWGRQQAIPPTPPSFDTDNGWGSQAG